MKRPDGENIYIASHKKTANLMGMTHFTYYVMIFQRDSQLIKIMYTSGKSPNLVVRIMKAQKLLIILLGIMSALFLKQN